MGNRTSLIVHKSLSASHMKLSHAVSAHVPSDTALVLVMMLMSAAGWNTPHAPGTAGH